jgi:uncharacterized membrane protein
VAAAGFQTFRFLLEIDFDKADSIGLLQEYHFLASYVQSLLSLCVLHILVVCLLIMPRTRCMRRRLGSCLKIWVTIFQLLTSFVVYSCASVL